MTIEERKDAIHSAILDTLDVLEDIGLGGEIYAVAFKQVLNQMVYARIEEWGEQHRDDEADGA